MIFIDRIRRVVDLPLSDYGAFENGQEVEYYDGDLNEWLSVTVIGHEVHEDDNRVTYFLGERRSAPTVSPVTELQRRARNAPSLPDRASHREGFDRILRIDASELESRPELYEGSVISIDEQDYVVVGYMVSGSHITFFLDASD